MQVQAFRVLFLGLAPLLAGQAAAQTNLFVNDFRDLPDADLTDLSPDADLVMPGVQTTLRSALEFANHQGGSWIVHLPAGVFALDRVGTEDFCRWGDLDVFGALGTLELRGVPGQSVIDASALAALGGPDRILDLRPGLSPTTVVVIDGVVLRGGQVIGQGGGARVLGGKLELVDTWIESCVAHEGGGLWIQSAFEMTGGHINDCLAATPSSIGRGGGVYVAAGAQPTFQQAQINANQADQRGGGVYVAPGAWADFLKCQIDGNRLSLVNGGSGGGIAAFGPVTLTDCSVLGNQANLGTGGGVLNSGSGVLGTFVRTTFSLNAAGSGGGMATSNSSAANVVECTFFGNSAANLGGGWSHNGPPTSVLQRSTFQANTAERGGGVHAFATLHCENSTFSGNSAQEGGGLYINGGLGSFIRSTTIAFNKAGLGAGVYMTNALGNPQVELTNSILAENLDTNGFRENFAGFPLFAPAANNFDSDGTSLLSSAANIVAPPNGYLNALLLPLANNGGPTATHELQAKSWAVGSGVCVSTIDQRGVPRLPPCDMGAYETNLAPPWIATYCTAKPTTLPGCLASMTSAGVPFVGNPAGFTLTAQPTPGGNPGIFFWSTTGPAATPFAGGFLCVQSPLTRSSAIPPTGTFGSCNGGYTTSGTTFLQDWSLGKTLWIQCWFRDPGNILDSSFSNALEVTVL